MRYSKQREEVYRVLCNTTSHPDVAWIYNEVQKVMPNIGLATVYRNLTELCDIGKIKRVSAEGSVERYDANVAPHAHLVCEKCGRITDVEALRVSVSCDIEDVTRSEVTLYGVCSACKN